MKKILSITLLALSIVGCRPEKETFQTEVEETLNRPAPPVVEEPKPRWAEDSHMQTGDLRIAVAEDSVVGYEIRVYDSVANRYDTVGWRPFGVKGENATFGLRVLTQANIDNWGLLGYSVGQTVMTIKVLCPVGNYSYTDKFAIQRDKGVPYGSNYKYPGLALQQVYTMDSEGYLDLYSSSDKQIWHFSPGKRFLDSDPLANDCDGSVIMCIHRRYFDSYYAWGVVPHNSGVPRPGTYLFTSEVNYKGFADESNKTNNHAAAFFTVNGTLIGTWVENPSNARPRPIEFIDAIPDFKGALKSMTLVWGGTNNYYRVYKDGVFLGETRNNGFVHYFYGGYKKGNYTITSVIKGVGETPVTVFVDR